MVVMALAFAINIAGAMTPISHPLALLGMGIYQNTTGNSISLFDYMAFGIPLGLLLFLALILIMRFIIRPDMSKFDHFDVRKVLDEVKPMGLRERITVITFFVVVIAWVLPGILNIVDSGNAMAQTMTKLGAAFPPLIAVVFMAVIRVEHRPVIDLKDAFSQGMNWGVIFLVAAAILLGGALTKEGVGFSEFVITRVMPSIAGSPELIMVLAMAFATSLMTNFTSNVTTITLMTGVALSLALGGQNIHPAGITLITTFVGACAYMVPASFASIGVLYGNEYNNGSMTFRYGGLMVIVTTLLSTFIGYGWAKLILG